MIGFTENVIGCNWFVIGFVIVIGGDCDFCDLVLGAPGNRNLVWNSTVNKQQEPGFL